MKLFAELKRRNVLRASVLYIGAVWALAQGIAQLAPEIGMPDGATRWFLVAATIGFPFFVGFAWFYEFTPTGLVLESDIDPGDSKARGRTRTFDYAIIGVLAIAVVLLLTNTFVWRKGAGLSGEGGLVVPERSIAVLPFVNRSADKDQEFFSDGISEDMLNLLATVPQLKVISRSSSFSFKGKDMPLREIAQTLGVAYILEGSVQRAGKTLRISAQLVDARNDQNVWSQRWDRPFDDVFAIQDEIAGAVVGQLKLKLLGKTQEIDPEAYATYLQARQLARQGTRAGFEEAIPLFQQVLAKAPDYAQAWDQLATIYMSQASFGLRPVPEGVKLAQDAIDKALAADPEDATAYAKLGWLEMTFTSDLASSAQHFEKALALDPAAHSTLGNTAALALSLGRLELAIQMYKVFLAADPVSALGHKNLAGVYFAAHRPDEAIASLNAALRLSPDYVGAQAQLGLALLQKGDAPAALVAVEKEPEEAWKMIALPMVLHALGRKADSDAATAALIGKYDKDAAYNISYVLAYRGEVDRAFEWLDKAQEYQDPGLSGIAIEPGFDNLRKDPRWLPLLRKLGKAPEQLDKIAFNVTLPKSVSGAAAP
ncbi:MAG: tetratricopeptide repeat protein [Thermomonas sp.]